MFAAWNVLWSGERKRQRAFFLFGLELILQLDTPGIKDFFVTFFRLPEWYVVMFLFNARKYISSQGISMYWKFRCLWQALEGFSWLEALVSGSYLVRACNLRHRPKLVALSTCEALDSWSQWSETIADLHGARGTELWLSGLETGKANIINYHERNRI